MTARGLKTMVMKLSAVLVLPVALACGADQSSQLAAIDSLPIDNLPKGYSYPVGLCTKDLNPYDNPSYCDCGHYASYDEQVGLCLDGQSSSTVDLDWSSDRLSLQAQLFDLLLYKQTNGREIFLPHVSARDDRNAIYCEARTSNATAQQYRCSLEFQGVDQWLADGSSLQAQMYHALDKFTGGLQILGTDGETFACQADTIGEAQVISYRCQLKLEATTEDSLLPL